MKLLSNKTLITMLVILSMVGYIFSCKRENMVPPPPATTTPVITRGNAVLLPGSMTKGDSTQWKLDKVHSSVLWSSAYVGAAGLLTGRFNQFGMHEVTDPKMITYTANGSQPLLDSSWAFYESDPTKIYFNGYVQINTSNTGEPGRDTGCNVAGMSTVKIINGTHNLKPVNLALIKSTKVEFDQSSNDYIVTLDLTWHSNKDTIPGVQPKKIDPDITPDKQKTIQVIGRLKYIPKAYIRNATTGAVSYAVFGLQLTFQFNCREFDIPSTSIADVVDIECNMNFNNK